jgi:4-hydroxybenzoyl-CoA thioesterase
MSQTFSHTIKVLFQHCDPAGIIFYPRYFEMVNQTVEEWFDLSLGYSFAQMHVADGLGVPSVSIAAEFSSPSRLGDKLTWSLALTKLGRTSAHVRVHAHCGDELRIEATPVLVCIRLDTGRPVPWSDALRAKMQPFLTE